MKILKMLLIFLFSFNFSYAGEQNLVKKKISKNEIHKDFLFSWRFIYSGLNEGANDGLDIWGLEGYSRFAITEDHGLNFSMAKFVTFDDEYNVGNGAVGTRVSLGYSYAITGSLSDRTYYTKIEKLYIKKNKFKIKERLIKRRNKFDGFKIDLNLGHMNFNSYDDNLYSFSSSLYYEHRFKKIEIYF